MIVLISRTHTAADSTFVGKSPDDTAQTLVDLLFKVTPFSAYMLHVVEQMCNQNTEIVPVIHPLQHLPYNVCNAIIPANTNAFVYLLMSVKDFSSTYIGQTNNLAKRIEQHNRGIGATSTGNRLLRPWHCIAFVTGFDGSNSEERRRFERDWQNQRNRQGHYALNPWEVMEIGKYLVGEHNAACGYNQLKFTQCMEFLQDLSSVESECQATVPKSQPLSPNKCKLMPSAPLDGQETASTACSVVDQEQVSELPKFCSSSNQTLDQSAVSLKVATPFSVYQSENLVLSSESIDVKILSNASCIQPAPTMPLMVIDLTSNNDSARSRDRTDLPQIASTLKQHISEPFPLINDLSTVDTTIIDISDEQFAEQPRTTITLQETKSHKAFATNHTESSGNSVISWRDIEAACVGDPTTILFRFRGNTIPRGQLHRLLPGQWLSDDFINFYGSILNARTDGYSFLPGEGTVVFTCFFFTLLVPSPNTYHYDRVHRWAEANTPNGLFQLKKLLIPINVNGNHWAIMEIDFAAKSFAYYDSLGMNRSPWISACKRYLRDELSRGSSELVNSSAYDFDTWDVLDTSHCVVQENSWDCGVFTIAFMDDLWHDRRVLVTQNQIPHWRFKIWQILQSYRNPM